MIDQQDKTRACRDCEKEFVFNARQQAEFERRGFAPPTRCPECHSKRTSRRGYGRGRSVKIHVAKCSVCGNEAHVPFLPDDTKPVYCDDCFRAQRSQTSRQAPAPGTSRKADAADRPSGFGGFHLDARLERAIGEAGYDTPTPVQAETIPICLSGRDLIGTAQTGTGKTAAFVLPILQHLLANPTSSPRTRVLVLTPTRELAEQVNDSFKQLGKHTKIKSATVYGGVAMNPQERALRNGADVIVACPGRLLDHVDRGSADLSGVEKLVLDEADRMLDMGFLPAIKRVLSHLPRKRHTMLFSATFAPELEQLTRDSLTNAKRVDVDLQAPAKTVAHALYPCAQHRKTALVLRLLDQIEANSVLIFTRTKHRANRIAKQIEAAGYEAAALHSNKSQNQRQLALDNFRSGACRILVATDIAARGLDVESISHVINYDIPDTSDTYIHRIGRTGRAEREGDAMTLVTPQDAAILFEIEKTLGSPIERRKIEDFDYDKPEPVRAPQPRAKRPGW